jgi:hypothetical protein
MGYVREHRCDVLKSLGFLIGLFPLVYAVVKYCGLWKRRWNVVSGVRLKLTAEIRYNSVLSQ